MRQWGKNCTEFKPSRWIVREVDSDSGVEKEKVLNPSSYCFPTFNGGFRLCLGKNMATIEAKMFASTVLQQFKLKVEPQWQMEPRNSVVFSMLHGMPVKVSRRA
jgi:cytochrome P450